MSCSTFLPECFSPVAEFKHKKISMSSNIVLLVSKNPEGEVRKQDKKVLPSSSNTVQL